MSKVFHHKYWFLALTAMVFLVTVSIVGEFGPAVLSIFFLALLVQLILIKYNQLYSLAVPMERLYLKAADYDSRSTMWLQYGLVMTPLMAAVNVWLGFSWVVAVLAVRGKALFALIHRLFSHQRLREASRCDVEGGRPEVVAYISGLKDVAYQINQWLPVLERLEQKAVVLVRERSVFDGMADTPLPVYSARTQVDVEAVLGVESVRTVLYPANTMKNVQAFRHYRLNHFFINHGESDKAVNQSKLLMAYDKLLVGGPLAERRLRASGLPLRPEQVEHVGRPQTELFLEAIEAPRSVETVLYAPTWEGFVEDVNYSSVQAFGLAMVEQLLSDSRYTVLFKPHPYIGVRSALNARYRKQLERLCDGDRLQLVEAGASIHDAMNRSDLMITDISSVLNEYLATNKPIIVCNVKGQSGKALEEEFPSTRAAYRLDSGQGVSDVMARVEAGDDLWERRKEVRRDSLGEFPEGSLARFQEVIRESVQSAPRSTNVREHAGSDLDEMT
ncbi:CDP-glycerol glycerophosphotransferase family protein [Thioalkalivibrio sp. ALE31]|uniref:CDP-glycerol glycerophosphotransferase family protein n=1 Tax=Thioalkalivibrio sp. ALE31 TaxID=1158182 RepID=UPI00037CABEC|nr:CDP-glycerol glycerophosphotransferase family protein [Thioalkalivibrio sp. ALE31]